MGGRKNALYRLVGLLYFVLIGWAVAALGVIAGLVYMVVDVVLQLIYGGDGLGSSGDILARLYNWPVDQLRYIYIGEPESFPMKP
jgi:hypothetical protein